MFDLFSGSVLRRHRVRGPDQGHEQGRRRPRARSPVDGSQVALHPLPAAETTNRQLQMHQVIIY